MNRRFGISVLGYAIISVIVLGIIMIITTPMFISNTNRNKTKNIDSPRATSVNEPENNYVENRNSSSVPVNEKVDNNSYGKDAIANQDYSNALNMLEKRINMRLENIEMKQADMMQSMSNDGNKYVCSIEGTLDAENNVVPIDAKSGDIKTQKLVFVCQYKN